METKWCFQAHLVMIKDLNVLCIRLKILPKSHYYITERLVRHVLIPKFERTRRVENTIFVLPKLTNFKTIDGFDNIDGGIAHRNHRQWCNVILALPTRDHCPGIIVNRTDRPALIITFETFIFDEDVLLTEVTAVRYI